MFKSIKTSVLALILVSTAIIAHAQTKITEGTAVYAMEASGNATESKVKFKDDFTTFSITAGPAEVLITLDNKNGTGLVTVDVPINQMQVAAKMSKEDVEAQHAKFPKFSEFKATGEKQVIAGYNAEKYTMKDDKGGSAEIWVTTELDIPANMITKPFVEVKGVPVKFVGPASNFTLTSVKQESVGELSVTKIPAGYEEMTYAEMMSMGGGGE